MNALQLLNELENLKSAGVNLEEVKLVSLGVCTGLFGETYEDTVEVSFDFDTINQEIQFT
jgi:hypothetical protein